MTKFEDFKPFQHRMYTKRHRSTTRTPITSHTSAKTLLSRQSERLRLTMKHVIQSHLDQSNQLIDFFLPTPTLKESERE